MNGTFLVADIVGYFAHSFHVELAADDEKRQDEHHDTCQLLVHEEKEKESSSELCQRANERRDAFSQEINDAVDVLFHSVYQVARMESPQCVPFPIHQFGENV